MRQTGSFYRTEASDGITNMGKNQNLTALQRIILDQVTANQLLRDKFFFTGGTALSLCYFHHRYSDDLDFFTLDTFDRAQITNILREWAKIYRFTFRTAMHGFALFSFLKFPKSPQLKVDFARYPYAKLAAETSYRGIKVDSMLDIAVNKITTISERLSVKDYTDLYFLLKKFTIWDLIEGARIKFRQELDPYSLADDFLMIEKFTTLPRMIKPLTLTHLKDFFRDQAKTLGKSSVR